MPAGNTMFSKRTNGERNSIKRLLPTVIHKQMFQTLSIRDELVKQKDLFTSSV
jgi:hypothetical protein